MEPKVGKLYKVCKYQLAIHRNEFADHTSLPILMLREGDIFMCLHVQPRNAFAFGDLISIKILFKENTGWLFTSLSKYEAYMEEYKL